MEAVLSIPTQEIEINMKNTDAWLRKKEQGILLCGSYKYKICNMDQAFKNALEMYEQTKA